MSDAINDDKLSLYEQQRTQAKKEALNNACSTIVLAAVALLVLAWFVLAQDKLNTAQGLVLSVIVLGLCGLIGMFLSLISRIDEHWR